MSSSFVLLSIKATIQKVAVANAIVTLDRLEFNSGMPCTQELTESTERSICADGRSMMGQSQTEGREHSVWISVSRMGDIGLFSRCIQERQCIYFHLENIFTFFGSNSLDSLHPYQQEVLSPFHGKMKR